MFILDHALCKNKIYPFKIITLNMYQFKMIILKIFYTKANQCTFSERSLFIDKTHFFFNDFILSN